MEIETSGYATGMAKNIKPITVHIRQDLHTQPGPSAKRTRHHDAKGVSNFNSDHTNQIFKPYIGHPRKHTRHHDTKGVSNFHLDQNNQIVRTHAGHPRCNYCFVASHPRTRCKIKKQDLLNGIDRAVHPEKGLLWYRNSKATYNPDPQVASIEQLPNEILEKISKYLTFEECISQRIRIQ